MSVFLDTNIVIFLVERTPGTGPLAEARVKALLSQGERLVISDLVRMECRVRPLRENDQVLLAEFDSYFASQDVQVASVTAKVCDRAAAIRAHFGFRPMDALHLAAATEQGCARFLTYDQRLARFHDIAVEILS